MPFEKFEKPTETEIKPEREKNPEYQKLKDISFEEVRKSDPDFEKARILCVDPDESKEMVEKELREELETENWWLQEEWQKKGVPKEQIDIVAGDKNLTVYNFQEESLTARHLEELERVVKEFSQIRGGEIFDRVQYILIDNTPKTNPKTGEGHYGYAAVDDKAIKLYPRGLEFSPYRIENILSFEGTIIHELSHSIDKGRDFVNDWIKKFGWDLVETKKGKGWELKEPEKCINSYARLDPGEDICESMVAALRNPKLLDPERLKFLKEILRLDEIDESKASKIDIQRREGKEIKLPKLESPVKYKLKKYLIKNKEIEWINKREK